MLTSIVEVGRLPTTSHLTYIMIGDCSGCVISPTAEVQLTAKKPYLQEYTQKM